MILFNTKGNITIAREMKKHPKLFNCKFISFIHLFVHVSFNIAFLFLIITWFKDNKTKIICSWRLLCLLGKFNLEIYMILSWNMNEYYLTVFTNHQLQSMRLLSSHINLTIIWFYCEFPAALPWGKFCSLPQTVSQSLLDSFFSQEN